MYNIKLYRWQFIPNTTYIVDINLCNRNKTPTMTYKQHNITIMYNAETQNNNKTQKDKQKIVIKK